MNGIGVGVAGFSVGRASRPSLKIPHMGRSRHAAFSAGVSADNPSPGSTVSDSVGAAMMDHRAHRRRPPLTSAASGRDAGQRAIASTGLIRHGSAVGGDMTLDDLTLA